VRPNGRADEESPDVPGAWVSIAEAARRLGVSPCAVRLRIDRQRIRWRPVGNHGREVWLAVAGDDDPAGDPGESPGVPGTEVPLLRARVEELLERAARAEGERDAVRAVAAVLREALAREADHARQERARADRLEAALAEARRPWLARLLEAVRRR
jgi:hypothetical protein